MIRLVDFIKLMQYPTYQDYCYDDEIYTWDILDDMGSEFINNLKVTFIHVNVNDELTIYVEDIK